LVNKSDFPSQYITFHNHKNITGNRKSIVLYVTFLLQFFKNKSWT